MFDKLSMRYSAEVNFTSAATDGDMIMKLNGTDVMVEVVSRSSVCMTDETSRSRKDLCLEEVDGVLKLKMNHPY